MKKAKCYVYTFGVTCPHCREDTTDPIGVGSYMWVMFQPETAPGTVQECSECGEKFIIPKVVADNRL